MSQAAGPWFGAGSGSEPVAPGAAPGSSFGPLPLGPGAVPRAEAERVWELAARLAQLQTQLAVHWGEVARAAAQRFVTRAGALSGVPSLDQTLKLYELWVACAEEAYGATARTETFSHLQSELPTWRRYSWSSVATPKPGAPLVCRRATRWMRSTPT
jgi:hypothetical protein